MQAIIDEADKKLDTVIKNVSDHLPEKFPIHIADPIFEMMKKTIAKC